MKQLVYTKREAAAMLGVSEKTVDRLVLRGRLASTKIGGRRKFTERHIELLIKEGEV